MPRGNRGYALRYRLPDGSTAQPGLPAGLEPGVVVTAAVQLSGLLRLGLALGTGTAAPKAKRPTSGPERSHRGVQVIPPRPGRAYYALRYKDPVTLQCRQPRLAGVTTEADAHVQAEAMFRKLQERALQATLAGGREHAAAVAVTVREESAAYVADVALRVTKYGRPTSPNTVRQYLRQLESFAVWCDARGISRLAQLERSTLKAWLISRLQAPVRAGVREVSTVNQEVKPVRQMLVAAAKAEHLHLSSDIVRDELKRRTQAAVEPRCLEPKEIRATLQAALAYDDRPDQLGGKRRPAPIAPAVAVGLLSGMRRGELAALQCREVLFGKKPAFKSANQEGVDVIELPGSKTKTGAPRTVLTTSYSPLLGELLQALTRGRPGSHRVFGIGYQRLGDAVWNLRAPAYGAPADLNIKMLRSTCATCQLPLPADINAKAKRLGHTLAVAEAYYLATPTGLPGTQPNLEAVMECEEQVREVIRRVLQSRAVRS